MGDLRSSLPLSILLSLGSVGCASADEGPPRVPASSCEPEAAERWFTAMLARCRDASDRGAATRAHCIAATNVALHVLHDAELAAAVLRYRCDAFGADDNPSCPVVPSSSAAQRAAAR